MLYKHNKVRLGIELYQLILRVEHKPLDKVGVNVKVKVKLSLCLTKHHAMKTYWGVEV
jgi:hypothetical protein